MSSNLAARLGHVAAIALTLPLIACSEMESDTLKQEEDLGFSQDRAICGSNDLQDVNIYSEKLGFSRKFVKDHQLAVGAIESSPIDGNDNRQKYCTGTLIDTNLFLTAGHCINSSTVPSDSRKPHHHVSFRYEKNSNGSKLLKEEHFRIEKVLELSNPYLTDLQRDELDYAILELSGTPGKTFGITKIAKEEAKQSDKLLIIQHPQGAPKKVDTGTLNILGPVRMYYDIDTESGSSGAGILNEEGELVGVHSNAGCTSDKETPGNNLGINIKEIKRASKIVK